MKNIAKAIQAVMAEVKGIEKSMTIGSGNSAYKGVPDQEVKKIIGESMVKNGLCILPIGIEPKTQIDRWEEEAYDNFQKKNVIKQKQSVFTEVTTKYLLLHDSGESIELMGYGHGIDSQDKGAGKATTYALKYSLLYTFLVPTGKIDDADNTHSDTLPVPVKESVKQETQPKIDLLALEKTALESLNKCKTLAELKTTYDSFTTIQKNIQTVITEKDRLKSTLK